MIGVKDVQKRAKQVLKLGTDYIGIHTGIDAQKKGKTPLRDLKKLTKVIKRDKLAVAGGINLENLNKILKYRPEIIIVGSAITKAKNPEKVANKIKEKLK